MYKIIGLAKEIESPENPGALEKRVALIPNDVKQLIEYGCEVFVEYGAGEGVGFSNQEYVDAGANLQSNAELYQNKDLVIKFKGPAMESIPLMKPGSTLFCMAHFSSFPERAKLLEKHQINVVAMEYVVQSPEKLPKELVLGLMAADNCVEMDLRRAGVDMDEFHVIGYSERMSGVIRRLMNHSPSKLTLHPLDVAPDELGDLHSHSVVVFDSEIFEEADSLVNKLEGLNVRYYDVHPFVENYGKEALKYYRKVNPAPKFGKRKIEALHETGRAGARYGLKLLHEVSEKGMEASAATAVILGYGNVGMGAIHECYEAGIRTIKVLGKAHTKTGEIESYIESADLIVNGAEQPAHLRGINYLVTRDHTKSLLEKGTVVIDLIGGSPTNRSAVENVIECTYLTDPYFEEDGILFSALWGWPMMGFMRETAIKYSGQIADILIGEDQFIQGLDQLAPGVEKALVCGKF
ncbi:MAG: alanine dehydrogenase [Balneola sp.]|nr:MAG: alanine dehydrogenase [Balneola sp.]